jgi:hypothetical protein
VDAVEGVADAEVEAAGSTRPRISVIRTMASVRVICPG